jgi:hypothetical protein
VEGTGSDIKNFDAGIGQFRVDGEVSQQRLVEEIDGKW